MPQHEGARPLSGLRIIDASTEVAGPYCAKLLVDAGAEVIKVESPAGDPLRTYTAAEHELAEDEDGALFQFLNASKRSIVIDLDDEAGRAELRALCASADVLIESFGPGGLGARSLPVATLQADNPTLCVLSISPWGLTGPWAHRPATEFTLQAACGSIDYRGLPGRKPVFAGGRIGEFAAGAFAAVAAMTSWLHARNTGRGQHVDLSIFEAIVLCLTVYHDLHGQWNEGPLARGIEIPSIEPAKDGWVGYCTITGQQWTDFCAMLGRQDIAEDHRYLEGRNRMEHFELMVQMIQGFTREKTVDELIELAGLLRIPVAPVGNGEVLPEMDHMVARGVFADGPGGFKQPRPPYLLQQSEPRPFERAPRLGEHGDAIRAGLSRARPALDGMAEAGEKERPLEGLRVLDLTAFWAGPFSTATLADLGADVIKVESIQRPDGMRFAGAVRGDDLWEWSPVFHGANPGKRGITLQLESEEGIALVRELVQKADVVIENYSARVMEKFGLGWDKVRALNPEAIMVRMPAFGLDGPWRDRAGFAMTVEQVSGLAWVTGYRDLPLVVRGACDPIGGMHAVFALMLALENRRRTGRGELVELPLVEVAINVAAQQVVEFSAYGHLMEREENRAPAAAPQGVYACDGSESPDLLGISVANEAQWRAFVHALGDPDWARAPEYSTHRARRTNHDALDRRIEAWLANKACSDAESLLLSAGVPAQRLINGHDLAPNPQLDHRGFFQRMKHPVTGETRYPGLPMKFALLARGLHRSPPPTLGQHNAEVLQTELGLSSAELEALEGEQVIGTRPSFL